MSEQPTQESPLRHGWLAAEGVVWTAATRRIWGALGAGQGARRTTRSRRALLLGLGVAMYGTRDPERPSCFYGLGMASSRDTRSELACTCLRSLAVARARRRVDHVVVRWRLASGRPDLGPPHIPPERRASRTAEKRWQVTLASDGWHAQRAGVLRRPGTERPRHGARVVGLKTAVSSTLTPPTGGGAARARRRPSRARSLQDDAPQSAAGSGPGDLAVSTGRN